MTLRNKAHAQRVLDHIRAKRLAAMAEQPGLESFEENMAADEARETARKHFVWAMCRFARLSVKGDGARRRER